MSFLGLFVFVSLIMSPLILLLIAVRQVNYFNCTLRSHFLLKEASLAAFTTAATKQRSKQSSVGRLILGLELVKVN